MMQAQINIHAAKTNLSRLVDNAYRGESFIIAKAGKPMVSVIPFVSSKTKAKRVGFLKDCITVPDDFDEFGKTEIAGMFD